MNKELKFMSLNEIKDIISTIQNIYLGTYWYGRFYVTIHTSNFEDYFLLVNIKLGFMLSPERFGEIYKEVKKQLVHNLVDAKKLKEKNIELIQEYDYAGNTRHILGFKVMFEDREEE